MLHKEGALDGFNLVTKDLIQKGRMVAEHCKIRVTKFNGNCAAELKKTKIKKIEARNSPKTNYHNCPS